MNIEEIKPGMIFQDNDKRSGVRFLKVIANNINQGGVWKGKIAYEVSMYTPEGPYAPRILHASPQRFYREKKSKGYTLVQDVLV